MPRVRSKLARPAKGQEKVHKKGRKAPKETERAEAPVLESECEDSSAGDRNELKFLKERQDLAFEEMVQTLTSNIRKLLEAKITTPEEKNSKSSRCRKERQEVKALASPKAQLAEKTEDSKIGEDTESLTSKRKRGDLSRKLDKAKTHNGGQGKTAPPKDKVGKSMGGASCSNEGRGNLDVLGEALEREDRESGERKPVREMGARRKLEDLKNEEKAVKEERPPGAEGAALTLAADFSSATLEVGRQWGHIFSILGENGFDPKFLCKLELAFKCDGEIQTFSDLQSLRKFTSQKVFLKDLLKDILKQNANSHGGGRQHSTQRKGDDPLKATRCGAGDPASDGLNFLFVKEVKVARAEGGSSASSAQKGKESPKVEEQEASWPEEEGGGSSGEEEEEEQQEEETWGAEDEETWGVEEEEEEETWGVEEEEEEETWGVEEEENSGTEEEGEGNREVEEQQEEEGNSGMEGEEAEQQQEGGGSPSTEGAEAAASREEPACSRLGPEQKVVQPQEELDAEEEEEETAASRGPTWHWSSLSESLEVISGEHETCSWANLSAPSGVAKFFRKTEKERNKTLQIEELTSEETELIQKTEENFRRSVISIFRELQEEIENVRKCHPEVLEVKHSLDSLHGRVGKLEERMSRLDDHVEEVSKDAAQMSKQLMNNEKLRVREDEFRSSNIRVIGVPEEDTKKNGAEDIIKEIIEENFSELRRDSSLEVVSAQRVPSRVDERKRTPRHILVTFWSPSERERILKASRERDVTYRGRRIRLTADFSLSTLDARSRWCDIIRVLHENGFHPRIRYPAKLTFDFEGKTRTFLDTNEFRRFVSHVPSLKGLLENVL